MSTKKDNNGKESKELDYDEEQEQLGIITRYEICEMYGIAVAELERQLASLDGAALSPT